MKEATTISVLAFVLATGFAASPSSAETYPVRPIHIIIGFGPGSTADVLARMLGQRMSKTLGQQIVVENRPGAGSMIAAETVSRTPNDGYTLFMATVANTINPTLSLKPTFNLGKDMTPVALCGVVPNVLVAHPSVAADNVQELLALAKSNPKSLTFASSGSGTAGHLSAELFNERANVKIVNVFYAGGSAQALTDLLTGRVNLMFTVASTMLPQINTGKLKALAVAQAKRASVMPNVPTMSEAGLPGFDASIWVGLLAPPGTSEEIRTKLADAVNEALKTDEVLTPMRAQGFDPLGGSPAEFGKFIEADIAKWDGVTSAAGLKK